MDCAREYLFKVIHGVQQKPEYLSHDISTFMLLKTVVQ